MFRSAKVTRRHLISAVSGAALLAAAPHQTGMSQSRVDMPDMSGRSILITGCSSGFGRLAAEYFSRLGAKVFASMRRLPRPEAAALEALAVKHRLDISVLEIDVRSEVQVMNGVGEALERAGGRIDALVNNAGISVSGPVELQDMVAFHDVMDTNVGGCHRMARAVLPAMRAVGRGLIVNISSQLGRVIIPGVGSYCASKFALEALSEQMAYELAPHGIDVCIVQPGGYPTEIWENAQANTAELLARSTGARLADYPQYAARMQRQEGAPPLTTDPIDVPVAIAELVVKPAGHRPLRTPVHPRPKPQTSINEAAREAQLQWLGASDYGPTIRDVLHRPR